MTAHFPVSAIFKTSVSGLSEDVVVKEVNQLPVPCSALAPLPRWGCVSGKARSQYLPHGVTTLDSITGQSLPLHYWFLDRSLEGTLQGHKYVLPNVICVRHKQPWKQAN